MKVLGVLISQGSFDFWQDEKFRKLVDFDKISQTEQDRIFNELEVSVLGLFVLKFPHLEEQGVESFMELMREVGIADEFLKTWQELIDLRLKEYTEHYQLAIDETKDFDELRNKEERVIWSRIETITIDCLTHIRRGKVKKGDPLWKMLREWFLMLDFAMSKIVKDLKLDIPQATS